MSSSRRRGQYTAATHLEPTDSIVECPLYPALLPERVCTLPSSQCICRLYVQQLQTIHGRRWRTRMSFHALHIAYFSLYSCKLASVPPPIAPARLCQETFVFADAHATVSP
jgi:hypothetical protein